MKIKGANGLTGDTETDRAWRERSARKAVEKARQKAVTPKMRVGKPLERRVKLKAVSAKRGRENRQRRAMLERTYPEPENVMCVAPGCCNRADDAHEPLSRARGGSITEPANVVPLCRTCHSVITDTEPEWAYDLKILRGRKREAARELDQEAKEQQG